MIVGNGDIASAVRFLENTSDKLWFVSGVSNSQETRVSEYKREVGLLLQQDTSQHVVYVSSLCVFYADTMYARHKKRMEKLIKEAFPSYTIVRIGNITWGTNPHTILNFLRKKIRAGEPFETRDVYRYIVDMEEFLYWLRMIPEWNCEMNIVGKRLKVREIAEMIREGTL